MSKQAFKRVRRALRMEVSRKPLDAYAWPGGYPLVYVSGCGMMFCPDCVNRDIVQFDEYRRDKSSDRLTLSDVHWEGEPVTCDQCGAEIESAYGPVEAGVEC